MPLGDSLAEVGDGLAVYRYPLRGELRKASYNIAYMGTKATRPVRIHPSESFATTLRRSKGRLYQGSRCRTPPGETR
jgi:hypothetical protein